jgi:putative two-component system response regulator
MEDELPFDDSAFPALDEVSAEPEGLDDLPPFLRDETNQALSDIAGALRAVSACLAWKDPEERVRCFAGVLDGQPLTAAGAAEFLRRPPETAFALSCSSGEVACSSLVVPGLRGDFRLCLFGVPGRRLPRPAMKSALDMARLTVRMVRGARHLERLHWQNAASAVVSEMLAPVLTGRPLEETLGALAKKIADVTHSQSVSIDSFGEGGRPAQRNLYTDPSWQGWEEAASRWRELLQVQLDRMQRHPEQDVRRWRAWRDQVVIPDMQHPKVIAANPKEEGEFYIGAGLRTVVLQPLWVGDEFIGLLSISNRVIRTYSSAELRVISRMADVAAVAIRGARLVTDLSESRQRERTSYMENIARLAAAAEARDATTGSHLRNLQTSVRLLAEALDQDERFVNEIVVASQMHDVGKISVPDSILLKPGPLTVQEREIVKRHTIDGEQLLTGEMLQMAREVARSHHERWDGNGYPDGLAGEDTPFCARIVAVADVYDALISERPYKRAWPEQQAYLAICREAGAHFDVRVVEAFRELWKQGAFQVEPAA